MASRGSRHLKDEFKDCIATINAHRDLNPYEGWAWSVLSESPRDWLERGNPERDGLYVRCCMGKERFRQVLRSLVLKGYVETGPHARHQAGTITLKRRKLRLTGHDSVVNPVGGVVGKALRSWEGARGERLMLKTRAPRREALLSIADDDADNDDLDWGDDGDEDLSVTQEHALDALSVTQEHALDETGDEVLSVTQEHALVSVTQEHALPKKPQRKEGDSPSVTEKHALIGNPKSIAEKTALSVTQEHALPKKPQRKEGDSPSVTEKHASKTSGPPIQSISKSLGKDKKESKTKRIPTGAGHLQPKESDPEPRGKAKPKTKSKGPTKKALEASKARTKAEREKRAKEEKAIRDGGVKWARVEAGGKVSFDLDKGDPDEADYVRKVISTPRHPKKSKVLKRYTDEVIRQFTNFRNYIKTGFMFQPKLEKHAKELAIGCLCQGITPIHVFRYWHEEGASWTAMDDPSSSLSFMAQAASMENVVAAGPTRGKAAKAAKKKTKIAGHSHDPDDIHPELRFKLEGAGFDLSTGAGIDGDEPWSDEYLMSIQGAAETLAAGTKLWLPLATRKMSRWAAENMFGGLPE